MGRIIKLGVAAARLCLRDAAQVRSDPAISEVIPEAIITGTGLGCLEDTEKFLGSMIGNKEEFLTPTSFIQSTHNTVAGQIALLMKCHGYNFTFVHRGISFESALFDAIMQLETGQCKNVLVGGGDELTVNSFDIMARLGFWKRSPVAGADLLNDHQRGTIAGEGTSFLFLEKEPNANTYARLRSCGVAGKSDDIEGTKEALTGFLSECGVKSEEISFALLGVSGDPKTDRVYRDLLGSVLSHTPAGYFKHLCGEYDTATSFAAWLAAKMIREQSIPDSIRLNPEKSASPLSNILIYNCSREGDQGFILLSGT